MTENNEFPGGWDESRVRRLLDHYEGQTDTQAIAEDEASFDLMEFTVMDVPTDLVPAVRDLIAKRACSA